MTEYDASEGRLTNTKRPMLEAYSNVDQDQGS